MKKTMKKIGWVGLLLYTFNGTAQSLLVEAKIMNYDNVNTVTLFNKFEMGFKLPNQVLVRMNNFFKNLNVAESEKINPFVEWDFSLEAHFRHEESGTVKTIPAFYYREYERDNSGNTWHDIGTHHPMRIRFAPTLTGKWTITYTCKIKNKSYEVTPGNTFNVVAGNNKGFISIHPNKRNFQLDGQMIYPIGVNFPNPTRGVANYHITKEGTAFGPNQTFKVTKLSQWLDYLKDVETFANEGGKFIRTLQSGWSSLLEFEKKGNYYDRQPYAWEQDRFLELCEEKGIYIHFNLMQQEPFMKYGNYDMFDWDWAHYNRDKSIHKTDEYPAYCYADDGAKEPHEMFLDEEDLRYHEQRTRYYLARYGYSTSIYLFELLSEPWHLDQFAGHEEPFFADNEQGAIVRKAVQNYHERMATYIKKQLKHDNQPIGIDIITARFFEGEMFIDQSIYHPLIDVISFNAYSSLPEKLLIAKSENNNVVLDNENSMARIVLTLSEKCNKPVCIAEGGSGDDVDGCSNFAQYYLDMMSFGFSGIAGYHSWLGWSEGERQLWSAVIQAQLHFNSPAVLQTLSGMKGKWIQGRQQAKLANRDKSKAKELQYYISQDLKSVAGYVKNRTFNYYTMRTNENCAREIPKTPLNVLTNIAWKQGKPLYVEGLENEKTYEITWYDFKTGKTILTECVKPKRGKLKLQHPDLTVTPDKPLRPELWFTMVQKECSLP